MLQRRLMIGVCAAVVPVLGHPAGAEVISGQITDWVDLNDGGGLFNSRAIGDGTNHVTGMWSMASWDPSELVPDSCYFYGITFTSDTEVAFAAGISSIDQLTDASIFSFTNDSVSSTQALFDAEQPSGIGDFVVLRNATSGHYGVMRIDDVYDLHPTAGGRLAGRLDVTWWFQTDGSSSFAVPGAPTCALFAVSAVLVGRRRRGD